MIAIDVGANRGVYTFPLSKRAAKVVAYEPSPWLADYLKRGSPANVIVRNVAVSDTPSVVTLRVPKTPHGKLQHNKGSIERYESEGMAEAQVEAVRLDDENLQA